MEWDVDNHDPSRGVLKTKLKHLLSNQQSVDRIRRAVDIIHVATSRALVFGKLLYLTELDKSISSNGGRFDSSVASSLANRFPIDAKQIEEWIDVVSSRIDKRRGPPYAPEKATRLKELHDFYSEQSALGVLPVDKIHCTNLSIPKGYAADQLATSYRNNVFCNFDKYIKRLVRLRLTRTTLLGANLDPNGKVPASLKKKLDVDVNTVVHDLLEAVDIPTCRPDLAPWMMELRSEFLPPAPASRSNGWRFDQQKDNPERWMPYMVWINRTLEGESWKKLYSPLIQRTSFVPGHICLDTTGLIDLLVADADETQLLKMKLEEMEMPTSQTANKKYDLPGLRTKGQLYDSLNKLVAPSLLATVKSDPIKYASAFKTAIWSCLTKIAPDNKRVGLQFCGKVFNNMISTDGYSVSIHYVKAELVGVTRFNGGYKSLKKGQKNDKLAASKKGSTYVTDLSEDQRESFLRRHGSFIACDPGKGVLATMTDGRGKVIKYTSAQRRRESGEVYRAKERRRLLMVKSTPTAPTAKDLERSIGTVAYQPGVFRSSRSCITLHYSQYILSRKVVEVEMSSFYHRNVFRAHRYDAYIGRRSSEDRFASRIKKTFGKVSAIFYGNWGKNPNIKNQPPSPGIGLRRRLSSYFTILLVYESYTSSVCPRCERYGLVHPRKNQDGGGIHHLLKCSHVDCSCPWWHRDILGALNIFKMGLHAMKTGSWSRLFSRAAAMAI